ncbi:MAG: hypothetical protein AAGB46_08415 [Verrucomicrobiota bacterium]
MRFLSVLVFCVTTLSFAAMGQQRGPTIGVDGSRELVKVSTRSSDGTISKILTTCFNMHGSYSVTASGSHFLIQVNPSGTNRASLMIFGGDGSQLKHSEIVSGADIEDAALRAIDRAVYKTSGLRGFFGGKLAFVSDRTGSKELYTSSFLLRNVRYWTNDRANVVRPRWSPTGDSVLFSSDKQGGFDIYEVDFNSQRVFERLERRNSTNSGAVYSPDGASVALIASPNGNPELYWGQRSFRGLTNLSNTRSGNEAAPSWSPDGTQLVLASGVGGKPQLYLTSIRGGMRRLPTNFSGYCAEPCWNPFDRDKISYTAAVGSGFQIVVHSLAAGKSVQVSREGSADAIESEWLNDGRHLIYTRRTANRRSIVLLDTVSLKSTTLSSSSFGNVSQVSFLAPR